MIAFGCPITDARQYDRYARPGMERAAEPDSHVMAHPNADSIFRAYNEFCDQAAALQDLEALVLVHQDAELMDEDFCARVRRTLADPDAAIAGCAGAVGVRSLAWWEGAITWARFTHQYEEMGGGEVPGLSWDEDPPSFARTGEVDAIDGVVLVMSPWAVRELRFDESLGSLHGYDLDICLQARAAGKKVVTADFRVVHHHSLDLVGDLDGWIAAHMRIADKWSEMLDSDADPDWKQRSRRAEAELAAAQVKLRLARHYVTQLSADFEALERSRSWRLTAPVRALKRAIRRRRHPDEPPPRELGQGVVRTGSNSPD